MRKRLLRELDTGLALRETRLNRQVERTRLKRKLGGRESANDGSTKATMACCGSAPTPGASASPRTTSTTSSTRGPTSKEEKCESERKKSFQDSECNKHHTPEGSAKRLFHK